jgi:hypothetical protein
MRISDPDILEEGYRYALRFIQPRPFPSSEETRAVLEELKRPDAKPENFMDLSLKELEKERFFQKFKPRRVVMVRDRRDRNREGCLAVIEMTADESLFRMQTAPHEPECP